MAGNNNTENSNIAEILRAIINGSTDYPDFKDNPPSKIALLLMLLGNDISAIKEIVANLPDPLVPKGTLGNGTGDLPDLPTTGMKIGDTYFVATAGTYNNQPANIGDMFYYNDGGTWSYVPTGDVNTWRNIFVNNTEVMGIDNKDALKLVDSSSVKVNYDGVNKAVSFTGAEIKSFTYTGNGEPINTITLPVKPLAILSIFGAGSVSAKMKSIPFMPTEDFGIGYVIGTSPITVNAYGFEVSCVDNVITISASQGTRAFNAQGEKFTVYYI